MKPSTFVCSLFAALLAVVAIAQAAAGDVVLISRADGVSGADANATTTRPDAEGHFVAMLSTATNLTADAVPLGKTEAFVRDLNSATNTLVSRADGVAGAAANDHVSRITVSTDGTRVAFQSRATNLVAGATTAADRSYVRDLPTGRTILVAAAPADNAVRPAISADGHWVGFASYANYDGANKVFLKAYVRSLADLNAPAAIQLVSRCGPPSGACRGTDGVGTIPGDQPSLSQDGRFVAFRGQRDLIGGTTDATPQILVRDRLSATTTLVSTRTGGSVAVAGGADQPDISANGRYVAFRSASNDLSDSDVDNTYDIFERDRAYGTTTLLSRADGATGAAAAGNSDLPSLSNDGRRVIFRSTADNLSDADNDNGDNAYVRDVVAGTTTLVHGAPGQTPPPQGVISGLSLSTDGLFAFYDTNATLLPGTESGSHADVFRRELAAPTPPPPLPSLSISDVTAAEGAAAAITPFTFTVTLSAISAQPVNVSYRTADGTATAGSDYRATGGQLAFEPGQTTKTITVNVLGDATFENDESFTVGLSLQRNATLARATATGTIVNDDPAPPPPQ